MTLVRNTIDCIIWVKLDKIFFNMDDNVYICFTYIAPESSPVHNMYNIDIFIQLEQDILSFNDRGKILELVTLIVEPVVNRIIFNMIGI